jgi:hypothetical protein
MSVRRYLHSIANGLRSDVCPGGTDPGAFPNVLAKAPDSQGFVSRFPELLPMPTDVSFLHLEEIREVDLEVQGKREVSRGGRVIPDGDLLRNSGA